MGIVTTFFRHIRLFDLTFLCKMSQIFYDNNCISPFFWQKSDLLLPAVHKDMLHSVHLEDRKNHNPSSGTCQSVRGKLTSVSSLFSQDLCLLQIFIPVKKDCTAFSHIIVLVYGNCNTQNLQWYQELFPLIKGILLPALRLQQPSDCIFFCNLHNGIHLTGNPCIVDRDDHFCFLSHCRLDQFLINIHCIRSDINKYNLCSL